VGTASGGALLGERGAAVTSFRWAAVKLTIFTIVTAIVTTMLASSIGNFPLFSNHYDVTAEFNDATGLLKGDVVKAAGVTVGRVTSIEFADGIAEVTLSIDSDVDLPADLIASIRYRNLVGQRMIVLREAAEGSTDLLEAGALIPLARTEPAFDLSVLFNSLRPLIRSTSPRDINIVTHELLQALSGRGAEIEGVIGNIATITHALSSKDQELSVLLKNVNTITEDLSGRDVQLTRTLGNINRFLTSISLGRQDLAVAIDTLEDAAKRLERVVAENDGNIKAEVDDLGTLLDAVNDKKADLKDVVRRLPEVLRAVERVNSYGEWSMVHLVDACKDDFGTCGRRWQP
jgi:phospholipid/cholesterol/gamma-HCH transport system substrate-binding protein